jgi:hypothetical protein
MKEEVINMKRDYVGIIKKILKWWLKLTAYWYAVAGFVIIVLSIFPKGRKAVRQAWDLTVSVWLIYFEYWFGRFRKKRKKDNEMTDEEFMEAVKILGSVNINEEIMSAASKSLTAETDAEIINAIGKDFLFNVSEERMRSIPHMVDEHGNFILSNKNSEIINGLDDSLLKSDVDISKKRMSMFGPHMMDTFRNTSILNMHPPRVFNGYGIDVDKVMSDVKKSLDNIGTPKPSEELNEATAHFMASEHIRKQYILGNVEEDKDFSNFGIDEHGNPVLLDYVKSYDNTDEMTNRNAEILSAYLTMMGLELSFEERPKGARLLIPSEEGCTSEYQKQQCPVDWMP